MLVLGSMGAAVLVVTALIVVLPLGRDHTVHDDDPTIEPVPTSVDEVAWQWEPDEETIVERVHPGPAGPLVLTDTGAIALSGSTGDELWNYALTERDGTRIETGTTPGGEHTLIAQAEGEPATEEHGSASGGATGGPFETEVAVIDSRTGELQDRYTYTDEDPLSDLQNLAGDTWLEPHQDGLRARSINDGQTAWTYNPPDNCELTHHSDNRRFDGPVIGTTVDTYLLPLSCPTDEIRDALDHDPDELPEKAPGQLTALDTRTGEPAWPESVDLTLTPIRNQKDRPYVDTRFTLSIDGRKAIASAPTGESIIDTSTGEIITTQLEGQKLFYFGTEYLYYSRYSSQDDDSVPVTTVDPSTGEQDGEEIILDPGSHDLQSRPEHDFLGDFSYSGGFSYIPLEQGILAFGCRSTCDSSGDSKNLSTLFFGANEASPNAATIPLPGLKSSQGPGEHFVPTPGAIVAVQYTSDSPSGIAPLTGLA
ncbi:hypothetical protein IDM40_19850 [Nocardiopsis sp. HNM0947]|uniref:Uncharacterized protein n=1 Tax=Nocardiopsis coralli TaxID=2772213 RepID=A0ABR9PAQ9_9ACTN|nr:hypothetical protein [Nocardiopsis coralli]